MRRLLWKGEDEALVKLAGAGNLILEVGSFEGGSTICLCNDNRNFVIALDPFIASQDLVDFTANVDMARTQKAFIENIKGKGIAWVHAASGDALSFLRSSRLRFDRLFVDGCHIYDSVKSDCEFLHLVKPGGLAIFHDYANAKLPDVRRAVDEYLESPTGPAVMKREIILSMLVAHL